MIVEVEVVPRPPGTPDDPYRHVDAAIAAIARSGVPYEVGALGTTFEAPPDAAWGIARQAHEAALASGADALLTVVKLSERAGEQVSMHQLTGKFRR